MKIRELMTERVCTCRAQDSLARAAQIMWDSDCGAVPVVDDKGLVVGMITDRDIAMAAFVQWVHLSESFVATAMSQRVCTCSPDDEIGHAAEIMRKNQVRRLPVVDGAGNVVGLLSLGDIARYVRLHTPRGTSNLSEAQVNEAFVAVCEPRFRSIPPPPPSPLPPPVSS